MKIRSGFVSNSSSTSFCIMGITEEPEYDEQGNIKQYDLENNNIVVCRTEEVGDYIAVGLPIENIKDDETYLDFKTRAYMELCNAGKHVSIKDIHLSYGGWYDG